MFKRKIVALCVAFITAMALIVLASGTAYAADNYVFTKLERGSLHHGGMMVHYDNGDKFRTEDILVDSHGVRSFLIRLHGGGDITVRTRYVAGEGDFVDFTYNIREGERYRMKVCLTDGRGGTPFNCKSEEITE